MASPTTGGVPAALSLVTRTQVEGINTTTTPTAAGVCLWETTIGDTVHGCMAYQEDVTLATDNTANTLTAEYPSGAYKAVVNIEVTTSITTAINYDVGITGTATAIATNYTGITSGTNQTWFYTTPNQTAAAIKFLITTDANPGAGALRFNAVVWYYRRAA